MLHKTIRTASKQKLKTAPSNDKNGLGIAGDQMLDLYYFFFF